MKVKNALAFAWIKGGWDGNQDGVMEGSQHNTMDVSYFGPNPQMQFWYFGALRAATEMANAMNDTIFAEKCTRLLNDGNKWVDKHLFNGEYYEQKITDPATFEFLNMDDPQVLIPDYQLGKGCLVDQLAGQYMAHICGLGYLANKQNIKTTLKSVMKYNYVKDFSSLFNNMRSYVIGDESGLIMASWPKGRLKVPFPYFAESMSGFEYTAAVGMIYEGQINAGLKCIQSIRSRFDGYKRNPFDEAECGHHYARAMASWAATIALSEFQYSAVTKSMTITSKPGRYFWSNGYSWGICEVKLNEVIIEVLKGSLDLNSFTRRGRVAKQFQNLHMSEGEKKIIVN